MSIATIRGRLMAVVMLVLMVTAATAIFAWCSRTPTEVRENEALLATLPVYPEAVEFDRTSTAYNFQDGVTLFSPPEGWGTRVTYAVPPGTTAEDVRAFFESAIDHSWEREVDVIPIMQMSGATPSPPGSSVTVTPQPSVRVGEVLHLSFCRDGARISLNTDNVLGAGTFDLHADASWAEPGYRSC